MADRGAQVQRATAPTSSVGSRVRWSLLGNGAGIIASTATYLAISRVVDPAEYGRAAVVLAVWGLLFNSIDWCGSLLMRFGPVELQARGRLSQTISTRLLFALPPLVLLVPAAPVFLHHQLRLQTELALLTSLWLLVCTAYNVLNWSAIAAQRFRPLALATVVVKGAPLPVLVWAAAHAMPVGAGLLIGTMFVGFAAGATVLLGGLRGVVGLARPDRALAGAMWRFALPQLVGMPALAAIAWLDPLLLNHYAPAAEVGRYQLACPTITIFAAIGAALNAVLSPELVRASAVRQPGRLERYRDREQPAIALVLGLLAFVGACVAAPVVRAILPASYAPTAELVALLSIGGGFLLAFWTLHPLVNATDRVWSLQLATTAQAVVSVTLDVALAPRLGGRGVAISNASAWAFAFLILTWVLRKRMGVSAKPVVPLVASGTIVAVLLVTGAGMAPRMAAAVLLAAFAGTTAVRAYRRRNRKERDDLAPRTTGGDISGTGG